MSAINYQEPSIEKRINFFNALNQIEFIVDLRQIDKQIDIVKGMLKEIPSLVLTTSYNKYGFAGLTPIEKLAKDDHSLYETKKLLELIFNTLKKFDLTKYPYYISDAVKIAIKVDNYIFIEEMINYNYNFTSKEIMSLHKECAYFCIKVFISKNIDINYNENRRNGLFFSASSTKEGTIENLKLLLANRYNVNQGIHPLIAACMYGGEKKIVNFLLEKFPEDINVKDPDNGWTPLHYALGCKSWELVELLIKSPMCDLTAKNNAKQTPFSILTSCLITLKKQDNYYSQENTKKLIIDTLIPIWDKFYNAEKDVVRVEVEEKGFNFKDLALINPQGYTPLHLALENEIIEWVKFLISKPDINLTAITKDGKSPFSIVAEIMIKFSESPSYKEPLKRELFKKNWLKVYEILEKADNDALSKSTDLSNFNEQD
jgi:ankyrin repeat protein